jgi:hypothetical protein
LFEASKKLGSVTALIQKYSVQCLASNLSKRLKVSHHALSVIGDNKKRNIAVETINKVLKLIRMTPFQVLKVTLSDTSCRLSMRKDRLLNLI